MSLVFATQLTAVATAVLGVFAIVTGAFAVLAFREQSREVRDQASMLDEQRKISKVQSDQLADQRKVNEKHLEVLGYQAIELQRSSKVLEHQAEVLKQQAELTRRAQVAGVSITVNPDHPEPQGRSELLEPPYRDYHLRRELAEVAAAEVDVIATVVNASDQPIYDAEIRWHIGKEGHGSPNPESVGSLKPKDTVKRTRAFPADADENVIGAELRFTDGSGNRWLRRPDGYLTDLRAS